MLESNCTAISTAFYHTLSAVLHVLHWWLLQDTTLVDVNTGKLDMSPYCSKAAGKQAQQALCSLSAITHHSGSMAGGHYFTQRRSGDRWLRCNDDNVGEEKYVEGPSTSAYMLFYRMIEHCACKTAYMLNPTTLHTLFLPGVVVIAPKSPVT